MADLRRRFANPLAELARSFDNSPTSRQRLLDLRPGSGHHGASYALYISYSVESEDELLATADLIEAAAADAGIEFIEWMDHRNDLALITTMPFTRGIR